VKKEKGVVKEVKKRKRAIYQPSFLRKMLPFSWLSPPTYITLFKTPFPTCQNCFLKKVNGERNM